MPQQDPAKNKPPAKQRILTTAHQLFYLNGVRATGIDRVIAESGVTKTTFYRHFPSKNDLIRAFLHHRHQLWLDWFRAALARHGGNIDALLPALDEWFRHPEYRGCAFINTVGELADELPEVVQIASEHKADMRRVIAELLPERAEREALAESLALVVDGAIVRAQYDTSPDAALAAAGRTIEALRGR